MLIGNIFLLLVLLAIAVPAYWAIPERLFYIRHALLVLLSLVMLFMISPILPFIPLAYFVFVAGGVAVRRWLGDGGARLYAWAAFVPPILYDLRKTPLVGATQNDALFVILGFGFCALRAFLCVREMVAEKRFQIGASLASLTFFATYLTGPVAGPARFAREAVSLRLRGRDALHGFCRIGLGAALFLLLRPAILSWAPGLDPQSPVGAWAFVFQKFLALYADFSGYSEVAIGSAKLFGITLPENFRWPLFSRSIHEFWRRWHLSVAILINKYVAMPITRKWGRPSIGIFTAFLAMGVWHAATVNYVIWGLGHGAALVAANRLREPVARLGLPDSLVAVTGWAFTLAYVAMISAIANAANTSEALALAQALFGLAR